MGEVEDGAAFIEQALILNPNLALGWLLSGWVSLYPGKPEVAIERARAPSDVLFERDRGGENPISFWAVDTGFHAGPPRPPLPRACELDNEDPKDPLRLRAGVIEALECAAATGDTPQRYFPTGGPPAPGVRIVVVDEASMLTEDQVAAYSMPWNWDAALYSSAIPSNFPPSGQAVPSSI